MIDKNLIKEAKIKEPVKNEFYELLKSKFPQTINSDGAVNFDAIKMLLDIKVKENIKGYELNWIGKGLANALYNTPCDKELKFNETKSKNTKRAQNIIIKGDNLDALKLLKSAYYEKIKMIYIDPPYNTKNDDFIYPDDFRKDYKQICIETGLIKIEVDEFGNETEVPSEAMDFFTSITSTKSHSGWLSFMLPRLKLARDLLKDDGVIFISIDDNEQANLKLLCDEIFGEENFLGDFIKQSKVGGGSDSKFIVKEHEYCLVYAKNINLTNEMFLKHDDDYLKRYKEIDDKGRFFWDTFSRRGLTNPIIYEIKAPDGTLIKDGWIRAEETFKKNYQDGEVRIIKIKDKWSVQFKQYLNLNGKKPRSMTTDFGGSIEGKNDIINLFDSDKIFSYPKSTKFISTLLKMTTNSNDIILDFFAGSGTTAHAVMAQNAQDNGNRKFILVQLDEKIDEKKSKTAFDFCKNELGSKEPVISDITIERVKRAGNKLEKPNLDTGFCVYDLTDKDTLIQKSDGSLELYLNRDLTPLDKALNLALQSGKTIDIKSEEICKDKLYKFDDSYYIISYDKNVLESLEATTDKPVYISGYNDIKLDDFLNLQSVLKDRLNVVY
ncbi:site-specific DNA-methyltransferase [Campylobacter sp. P0085]|uniref:site-specific DNA-methyltransferase n=1 Tax=Campylobacter sp. P0085 TaxID=1895597 RepID=UPI000A33C889|nr:site-specific DNA-methyltransferase [Campylobacter sp. P0085]